ncbi:hypothetical protein CGRA01v4_00457 [Colletotrichum graminicola]|uniref:N-acetyltransferase domain-containing protein n=1 Tax=Colletotrichum graminicola (strain M1.001 / M2 / FGSC 10212) TaxID=645133 RepID=E3QHJ1_COLGM|nr:uncharacterized protein GLRG_05306 [Colletotrichum graminicola M1.001]EFQ30162.1 hypothetical protein GLRG_05306 [Colletotrichum graminicola M1.001]WDK09179.1 hypothetical protein CGRA01v4_00457 [Colletotrichum graminicola]
MSSTRVTLIPWDPESADHITRMVDQRIACGWDANLVPEWQGWQRSGFKCIYWIALTSEDPERDAKIAKHVSEYPKETEPIVDTAQSIYAVARTATGTPFHPVGHISLDAGNPPAEPLGLPIPKENVFWVKSLYVSDAIQGSGIGRAAMDMAEAMAAGTPLCAKTLVLDTVSKEDQLRKESAVVHKGKLPASPAQAWYERRGYKLIHTVNNFYGFPETDPDGNPVVRRTVFLRKDIV